MKVLFYTDVTWSLGNIHNNLVKEFCKRGIYSNMLNWDFDYSVREFDYLNKIYDVFVTLPGPCVNLLLSKGIPSNKIICVAHSRFDVKNGVDAGIPWASLRNVVAISPDLVKTHKILGVDVNVELVQNGIDFELFHREPATELTRLGYFGSDFAPDVLAGTGDCKRKHLAESISTITGLPLIGTGSKLVNLCMPTLYESIDSLIMPSSSPEACGLPYMEAAAAGRLPISSSVGIIDHLGQPAGLVLRMDEESFVEQAVFHINELVASPKRFRSLCVEAQDFAHHYYDWSAVIGRWIDVLTKLDNNL